MAMLSLQALSYDFSAETGGEFSTTLYYAINPDGKTVTIVEGPEAYKATEVDIPATVTYEGKTYTVTVIGASAFAISDISRMVMANTITDIQDNAFNQSKIADITFSTGLKHIGNYAFRDASALIHADLPEGLETIGDEAFLIVYPHGSLKSVTLPSTLKTMGEGVFTNSALISVRWPASLPNIPNRTFAGCTYLSEVELPEGLVCIGTSGFSATNLSSIAFPSTLEEIGSDAFYRTKFKELTLPNHIKTLGERAFIYCDLLESITFSTGMTELPTSVCSGCEQLVEVNIPSSITKIGEGAFSPCPRLNNIVIPESVVEMGERIFQSSGIINITLPSSLHYIPGGTFTNCQKLTNITIPESVDSIGASAFYTCSELEKIDLPKKLRYIDASAFYGCKKIKSLTLGNYVERVANYVFGDMDALQEVHVTRSLPPAFFNSYHSTYPELLRAENATTLYVPKGTKQSYEIADGWKDFYQIVEEDVDGSVNYFIQTRVVDSYGGSIQVNGTSHSNGVYEISYSTTATLMLQPNEGYMLEKLTINGKDVTQDVTDNQYVIDNVDENKVVVVSFKYSPIILSIRSGHGGSMEVNVEKYASVTFSVNADNNWKVNSVMLDGMDVTDKVVEGKYTTPALSKNTTLNISFEQTATDVKAETLSTVKAYGQDGMLYLSGLSVNDDVKVMDTSGIVITSFRAVHSSATLTLTPNAIYFISVQGKTLKVAL